MTTPKQSPRSPVSIRHATPLAARGPSSPASKSVSAPFVLRRQTLDEPGLERVAAGWVVVEEGLELTPCFRQSLVAEQALDQDHPRLMVRRVEAEGIPRGRDGRVPFPTLEVEEGDHLVVVRTPRVDRDGPSEVVECLLAPPQLGRPG